MVASDDQSHKAVCGGFLILFAIVMILLATMYLANHTGLLVDGLKLLPDNPGWDWFFGWTILLAANTTLGLPIWSALFIVSGLVFGLKAGTAINFIALYIGVVVSLLLGKTVLQEPVRQWLDSGNFPLAQRALQCLEEADDSFQILILFRFLLMPIWMRNYAPSTLRFPLWKLLVSAIPHTLWASFVLASLGTSLQDVEEVFTHDSHFKLSNVKWQNIAMFIVSCLTAVLISLYSYKKYSELTSGESTPLLEHGRKEP